MHRFVALMMIILGSLATQANADPIPGQVKSALFLEAVATRGLECGLLEPWQASSLRALNIQDMERWSQERRNLFDSEIDRSLSNRSCDDEAIAAWIEGASRGFDVEMLPPYLIVYRTLVGYETPPTVFRNTTTRLRYGPAVSAINDKLTELAASGHKPEGGGPWPDYITGIEDAAREFVSTLADKEADLQKRNQASAWIAQSAHIVELWLLKNEK